MTLAQGIRDDQRSRANSALKIPYPSGPIQNPFPY
jgi:hypothetical protein